ncbi:MAG: DUF4105 domain-containing protein [Flavobacteriaceae bacterium]
MRVKFGHFIFFLTWCLAGISQPVQLSPEAQISVITCGPGSDLYASFGHSAFRVQDPEINLDLVYNYGTFDFDAPNFYLNFARGRPVFKLSRQLFVNFLYTYQLENRWVKEQILDLESKEKKDIFRFLENNYRPENRNYKYDYLWENCSTKIPEVLSNVLGKTLVFREDHLLEQYSFRELMQQNLSWNSWGSFGIDLALGSVIDRVADEEETMFLPDYVFRQMNNSSVSNRPLVRRQRTILDLNNGERAFLFTTSPLFWTLFLFVFTITITLIDYRNQTRSRWLDFVLLLLTGMSGMLITYLWFFSDHSAAANNYNILWALPFNIIIAFFMAKKGPVAKWLPRYFRVVLLILILVPVLWVADVQGFPPLASIILLILAVRYLYLDFYFRKFYPVWVNDVWKSKR